MALTGVKLAEEAGRAANNGRAGSGIVSGEKPVIDEEHLRQVTLGDVRLEREVLQIFVRQTAAMLERIAGGEPKSAAAAAHTLIGSARGIGAWRLAAAAERLERASAAGSEQTLCEAIAELKTASLETSAAIAVRLGAPAP